MLENIPSEILSEIFSLISIRDSRVLLNILDLSKYKYSTEHRKLCDELRARLSIHNYLGRYFPSTNEMLQSMLINNVLISGSRAVDFFMPGSADEDSDWDLYIGNDPDKVKAFTNFMENKGVVWTPETEVLEELSPFRYPDAGNISILQGTMIYRSKTNRIQLITYRGSDNLLDIIRKFSASIAQCFISPYMACHMYSYDLYSKSSTIWNTEHSTVESDSERTTRWTDKYKKRGFKFYYRSMHTILCPGDKERGIKRTIGDANTDVVAIDPSWYPKIRYEYIELAIHELYSYSWLEFSHRLEANNFPSIYNSERYSKAFSAAKAILDNLSIGKITVDVARMETEIMLKNTMIANISKLETIEGSNYIVENRNRSSTSYGSDYDGI